MPNLTGHYWWRTSNKDVWDVVFFDASDQSVQKIGQKSVYSLKSVGGEFGGRIIPRGN